MKRRNSKLLLILCLSLIFVLTLSLISCKDKDKDNNNDATNTSTELTTSDIDNLMTTYKLGTSGTHNLTVDSEDNKIQYKDIDGFLTLYSEGNCIFKKDNTIYNYEKDPDGDKYTILNPYEQNQITETLSFYNLMLKTAINNAYNFEKISIIENEGYTAEIGDLYKVETTGSKNKDGYTINKTIVLGTVYSGQVFPTQYVVNIKLNNDKVIVALDFTGTILDEYLSPNATSTATNNDLKYSYSENTDFTIPSLDNATEQGKTEADFTLNIANSGINTFADGSTSIASKTRGKDITLSTPKSDYFTADEFLGWYYDNQYTNKIENNIFKTPYDEISARVYPKWKQKDGIVFELNGGVEVETLFSKKLENAITFSNVYDANINKEGYSFEGWYTTATFEEGTELKRESVVIPANTHIYAKFVQEKDEYCNITFISGDIGYKTLPSVLKVKKNTIGMNTPEFIVDNKVIDCWCTDPELTKPYDITQINTKDITLYAKYKDGIKVTIARPNNFPATVYDANWVMIDPAKLNDIYSVINSINDYYDQSRKVGELYAQDLYIDDQYTTSLWDMTEIPETNFTVYAKYTTEPHTYS